MPGRGHAHRASGAVIPVYRDDTTNHIGVVNEYCQRWWPRVFQGRVIILGPLTGAGAYGVLTLGQPGKSASGGHDHLTVPAGSAYGGLRRLWKRPILCS